MKPPKFHVGQAVVCVKDGKYRPDCPYKLKKGQVYEVAKIEWDDTPGDQTGWWITCCEWADEMWVHESLFVPVELLPDEALVELIAETLDPVTA